MNPAIPIPVSSCLGGGEVDGKRKKQALNVGLGIAMGVAIGMFMDNVAMGISIGLALAVTLSWSEEE